MKFQFTPNSSKIYDFLLFPKFLRQKETFLESSSLSQYKEAIDPGYLDTLDSYQKKLMPFTKDIDFFYKQGFGELEFIDFFAIKLPLLNFETCEAVLDYLLTLNDEELKNTIIETLNAEKEEGAVALKLHASNEEIVAFLENLNLEATWKWNVFMIVQSPKVYVAKFVTLMRQILPIFLEIYAPFEQEVKKYGEYLVTYFEKSEGNAIEELSNGLINKSYIVHEENLLVVSALFAYSIIVSDIALMGRISWGLKIESALKKIKEINIDKLNERLQFFKYMGDKTKYEVLKYISRGVTSTKELAALTNVSSATISYHINAFLTSKIIILDSSNKKFNYVVNYALLEEILRDFKSDLNF